MKIKRAHSAQTVTEVLHNSHAYNQRKISEGYVEFNFKDERAVSFNKQKKPKFFTFGNLVVSRCEAIMSNEDCFGSLSIPVEIDRYHAIDVNSLADFDVAEYYIATKDRFWRMKILFFSYRNFDLRYLLSSNLLQMLSESAEVSLLTQNDVFANLGSTIELDEIEVIGFDIEKLNELNIIAKLCQIILKVTYSESKRINITAINQRQNIENIMPSFWGKNIIKGILILLSRIASKSRLVRKLFQFVIVNTNKFEYANSLLSSIRPNKVIVFSFGYDLDAIIVSACKRRNIPFLVIPAGIKRRLRVIQSLLRRRLFYGITRCFQKQMSFWIYR